MAIEKKVTVVLFFVFAFIGVSALTVNAATFVVNDVADVQDALAGDGLCATAAATCTLRAAITESNALAGADVITLPAGTYTITIAEASDNANANGDFDITSDITINGAGSGSTFVEANAAAGVAIGRVFHIRGLATSNTIVATLNGMTIRNGRYANNTFGAGIRIDQGTAHNVTLSNLVLTGNLNASSGGAIAISGSTTAPTVAINNCLITANGAGSAVAGTGANGAGLLINNAANVTIANSTISNNASNNAIAASATSAFGAGIITTGGTLGITNSTISGNTMTVSGTGNTAGAFAAGIYNQQAVMTLTDSFVTNNVASNTVTAGNGLHAGIRTLAGTTTLTNTTVSGNSAGGDGGGLVNLPSGAINSTVNIVNSSVFNNTSGSAGGGVLNSNSSTTATAVAAVNITNSTIRNNNAVFGAGIMNQILTTTGVGTATVGLTGSTVSGNVSTGNGGGIYNISFSATTGVVSLNSTNSTIAGNSGATGGGITNENGAASFGATANFNFSTIAANNATVSGGGMNNTGNAINLKNSVVGDNTATTSGPDIFGTITSQNYNHVENTSGGVFFAASGKGGKKVATDGFFALANDVTGTDPALLPLGNNGGPTQTKSPTFSSPITDTIPVGVSDCNVLVTTDQRGVARPVSTGCDKGAVELGFSPAAATASISGRVTSADGRGIINATMVVSGGGLLQPRTVKTSSFGYFSVDDLEVGETYILTINSKRFTFSNPSRVISLNDSITDVDFTADAQ